MDVYENHYLEDLRGEKPMQWVRERNAACLEHLFPLENGDPTKTELHEEILSVLDDKKKIPHVRVRGEYLYNFWQDAEYVKGIW